MLLIDRLRVLGGRFGVLVPITVILLATIVGCVVANDKPTTSTTTTTTKVTKAAGEGKTVQHVQVSEGRIRGAKERKATPITYIKTLGLPPTAAAAGNGGSNELHHAQPKLLDQTGTGKPKNGNRFAPKSLDVASPKDLSNAELFR